MNSLTGRMAFLARDRPWLALVISILAVEVIGASGGLFTAQGLAGWYDSLVQPSIAPPRWVFGPVWTGLFGLMGLAVWLVWREFESRPSAVRVALSVFAVHFIANLGWSAAFFGARSIVGGLVMIALLWLLILATMVAFGRVDRRAGWLLVPYLLWVSFAAVLNYQYWVLN
ncbi:MAG: TspO/MBR family protein [Halodesulfurarchaeum sp.]